MKIALFAVCDSLRFRWIFRRVNLEKSSTWKMIWTPGSNNFHVEESKIWLGRRFTCTSKNKDTTWWRHFEGQNRGAVTSKRNNTFIILFQSSSQNMKFTIAVLSLATTASAFTPSVSQTRSLARTVGGGSSILAPVPVRAAGT